MKTRHMLILVATAISLASCATSVTESPVHTAPSTPSTPVEPDRPKPKPRPAPEKPDGALKQVPAETEKKDKAFPDIPLKEDTGTSPLIHNKPDSPSYKRSAP